MKPAAHPKTSAAFTLVELLAVMVIIVLVASFLIPSIGTILRGSNLTQASDFVESNLTLARQSALASNQPIEVRFYQYGDSSDPGEQASNPASGHFRAMQLFQIAANGSASALGKVERLPQSVIMSASPTLSTLLGAPQAGTTPIPRVGTSYNMCSFRFRPDGSTTLNPTAPAWCLTLVNVVDGDNKATPPANYSTTQIDPVAGTLTTYRP